MLIEEQTHEEYSFVANGGDDDNLYTICVCMTSAQN